MESEGELILPVCDGEVAIHINTMMSGDGLDLIKS